MDYKEEVYSARWHLDVAKRMLQGFSEYGSKRFLVGVIREGARAAGKLVRAFLIREGTKGNLKTFVDKVAPAYLDGLEIEALVRVLELERDQRRARVEILREDEILLEIDGKWKILKVDRLREFVNVVDEIARKFSTGIKR
ncbi:hypothetical protein HNV12_02885 [Methanococcoides sp. SA1]|nr:hypothetical protein [Methanococcoides sp. SA1]